MDYCATITTCGNPDKGQDPYKRLPDVPLYFCQADTLQELKHEIRKFCGEFGIGAGNWTNPRLNYKGRDIGYLSFNGRAWADNGQEINDNLIAA